MIFVGSCFFTIQTITSKLLVLTLGSASIAFRFASNCTGIMSDFRDETGLKSLFRTTNEMFYERCGVGTVDISFPSNHLMFSKTIKNMNYFGSKNQFPFIIFKESWG